MHTDFSVSSLWRHLVRGERMSHVTVVGGVWASRCLGPANIRGSLCGAWRSGGRSNNAIKGPETVKPLACGGTERWVRCSPEWEVGEGYVALRRGRPAWPSYKPWEVTEGFKRISIGVSVVNFAGRCQIGNMFGGGDDRIECSRQRRERVIVGLWSERLVCGGRRPREQNGEVESTLYLERKFCFCRSVCIADNGYRRN